MAPEPHRIMTGLPLSVVGPVDLGRLIREVEYIDNALLELRLRGTAGEIKLPKTSRLLDETVQLNKLNLLHENDRKSLQTFLKLIRTKAPRLHVSFSADPSPFFTQKLMSWLRQQIHPTVLLTIGMQPNIGAGCVLRTTNKQFDFSLNKHFDRNRAVLLSKLREVTTPTTPASQPAMATTPAEVTA